MKKRLIVASVVLIEIILSIVVLVKIYNLKTNVSGVNFINPIRKEDLIFKSDENLKHFFEYSPNITITQKPYWLPTDYSYAININSDSLNERFDYSPQKSSKTFRIITLGDSFTHGLYVNTSQNYPERLEDLLSNLRCDNIEKFEVINLGVGGYDIAYSANRFKLRGQKYEPDLLIWLVQNNDFSHIQDFINQKTLYFESQLDSTIKDMLNNDEKLKEKYRKEWVMKAFEDFKKTFSQKEILNYQREALSSINSYKNPLIIITFPTLNNVYKTMIEEFVGSRPENYFYDKLPEDFDKFEDGHPTSIGYEQITTEVYKFLLEGNLLKCN